MKKIFVSLITVIMVTFLCACGEEKDVVEKYKLDLESSDVQKMSDERAEQAVLQETVNDFLDGNTMFLEDSESGKMTYDDFAEHIGCDASEYNYDKEEKLEVFIWRAKENENMVFCIYLEDGQLRYTGSVLF